MDRQQNRDFHNLYWGKVLSIFKKVDPSLVTLEQLWKYTCYNEMSNFSLINVDINSFDHQRLDNVKIAHGYTPAFESTYSQYQKEKIELVTREVPESTTQIVDMGSGWGRYSVILAKKYSDKQIFSLENSDSGVQACKVLKEKYNLSNLTCMNFDYYNPISLEHLAETSSRDQNAFFFSSHSIEQVKILDKKVFDIILSAKYGDVKCFHIEPIGWQIANIAKDTAARYNDNLYSLLRDFESKNLIRILKIEKDIYGKRRNTGSIITWKKEKRSIND